MSHETATSESFASELSSPSQLLNKVRKVHKLFKYTVLLHFMYHELKLMCVIFCTTRNTELELKN